MNKREIKNSRARIIIQAVSFAFHNGYVNGWVRGKLYKGSNKHFCVPGLNCYSCPGALGACPVGSLQATLGDAKGFKTALAVLGFIGMVGILCGRFVCGWLCPFGFIQDLLHKIPVFKKVKTLPGHKYLKYLKYAVLVFLVFLLPLLVRNAAGMGDPWFCEWICPSGTLLGGVPNLIAHKDLRAGLGVRFIIKVVILLAILIGSIKMPRPFCKYLCPLGAMYGLCNPVSTYRLKIDTAKCVSCGACHTACPMDLHTYKTPNSPECIRCGKCMAACPTGAISSTWGDLLKKKGDTVAQPQKEETATPDAEEKQKGRTAKKIVAAALTAGSGIFLTITALIRLYGLCVESGQVKNIAAFLQSALPAVTGLIVSIFLIVLSVKIIKSIRFSTGNRELREFAHFILVLTPVLCLAFTAVVSVLASMISGNEYPDIWSGVWEQVRNGIVFFACAEAGALLASILLRNREQEGVK